MISTITTTSTSDVFQKGSPGSGEPGEKDLYMDLFASLFTFPAEVRPLDPVKVEIPEIIESGVGPSSMPHEMTEAEALAAFFANAAAQKQKAASSVLSPDPIKIAPSVPSTPVSQDSLSLQKPSPQIDPKSLEPVHLPPENPNAWPSKLPEDAPYDALIPGRQSNCYMPPTRSGEKESFRGVLLSGDDADHAVDIEILEIPPPAVQHLMKSESEPILEIPGDTRSSDSKVADALSPTAVQTISVGGNGTDVFIPTLIGASVSQNRVVTKDAAEKVTPGQSLLETFTNNVFTESKPAKPLKTEFSELGESDDFMGEFLDPKESAENSEQATVFSFGSSLGGEAVSQSSDDAVLSESKAKHAVLDQVGSKVKELALIQKDGADKNVLKLRLRPADLGTVEITLAKNADGVLEAHFQTDSPHTQHILNESLTHLRESLENAGIKVGSLNTSCATFSSGGQEGNGERPREFPVDEAPSETRTTFDTNSRSDEEKLNRLVNLRA